MSESSSEYWKYPRRYAIGAELPVSLPSYYASESLNHLGEWIGERLSGCSGRILEVGCNCGRNLDYLKGIGLDVYGVEISPEAVEYAKTAFPLIASDITLMEAELYLSAQEDGAFEAIFTQGVLMHVPHNSGIFPQMARVAGGTILVNEVEKPRGIIERHKYTRSYKNLFESFGWKEVFSKPYGSSMTRVFGR